MAEIVLEARALHPLDENIHQELDLALNGGDRVHVYGPRVDAVGAWMRCLAAMSDHCAGSVFVLGEDASNLERDAWREMRTRIAYLGRGSKLLSVQTLMNNMILPALYHKRGARDELAARAQQLLEQSGMRDLAMLDQLPAYVDDFVYCRALIVRALLLDPKIMIVDHFLHAFNRKDAVDLLRYIEDRAAQSGMAAVVHHHDLNVFMESLHRVLFIGNEGLRVFDSREAFLACGDAEVRAYISDNTG